MPSRLRRHDEPGDVHFVTFSCYRRLSFFRHNIVCDAFIESMKVTRTKYGIRWLGYVVMPEHVHLLLLPQKDASDAPVPVSDVLRHLKGASGRRAKEVLRDISRRSRTLGTPPLDAWATGSGPKPFWKTRAYDRNVLREEKVIEKLDYVHANPVRRGLVDLAEEWRWSSYRFYEEGDHTPIALDWDGGFPMAT